MEINHKEHRALRTETTINNTRDFGIGKRLTNLPALQEIGFSANRRLLGVQQLSHDPAAGAAALAAITDPVTTITGTRVTGMRLTDPRVQALLHVLCLFRLLPAGFTSRDLRDHLAPLLGVTPQTMTSGQTSYDLRRLRHHQLIERIPHTFRYCFASEFLNHSIFKIPSHGSACLTGRVADHHVGSGHELRQGAPRSGAQREVRCDVRSHVVSGCVDWRFD